jgi:hypothetical protein
MRTVYVVGLPGAGKTTVVGQALKLLDLSPEVEHIYPVPHVRHGTLWHLGAHHGPFGGSDSLSALTAANAPAWVASLALAEEAGLNAVLAEKWGDDPQPHLDRCQPTPAVILGEGVTLASNKFLCACPDLTLVWLDAPRQVAADRSTIRARSIGARMGDAQWWQDHEDMLAALTDSGWPVVRLDGARPANESAVDLVELLAA